MVDAERTESEAFSAHLAIRFEITNLDDKPITVFSYPDGQRRAYDVLATVYHNAASIAHPAVICAIQHWEEVIRLRKAMALPDAYDKILPRDGIAWGLRSEMIDDAYDRAISGLQNIGKALLAGAKSRILDQSTAFSVRVGTSGLDRDDTYLHRAWELLGTAQIKLERGDQKLMRLESELRKSLFLRPVISIERVLDFLKQRSAFLSRRPAWRTMLGSFLSWRFSVDDKKSQKYRSRPTRKHAPSEDVRSRVLWNQGGYVSPDMDMWSLPAVQIEVPLPF